VICDTNANILFLQICRPLERPKMLLSKQDPLEPLQSSFRNLGFRPKSQRPQRFDITA
jgi:hypothetical protein